ncbi:hypothetical protein AAA126_15470 [Phocaeicola dorei]|jgi:hypothetical protein|uniref:hypothetical protein n=1 Tax=Phocaeicola dorei TaxID=357276 RepID=UPI0032C1390B
MENIRFLTDEKAKEIVKEWLDNWKSVNYENLFPSCIGEKIRLWCAEIDSFQFRYARLEDYAIMVRDYISQVKENDETLEEAVDEVASSDSLKFSNREYFKILKAALPAVASPLNYLKLLGFADPQKAFDILSMDESDKSVSLYTGLECNFDPSNKKQKYLFMFAYNKYCLVGGETEIQAHTKANNIICRCRLSQDFVLKYRGIYDYWKSINFFSPQDIQEKWFEIKNMMQFRDLDQLYNEFPYVIVENIFCEYYVTYENYFIFFANLSKYVRVRKMKQILKLASDSCKYSNDVYEEYVKYCISQKTEPVFQFGTLIYTSREMFMNASRETGFPYLDLGITYDEIKRLYDELMKREWIDRHTSFNLFVFYFSGKCKPDELSYIVWTTRVNELSYLLSILYKEKLSSTVPYKTVRQIFVVQGKLLADDRRNLSALADGLGVKRKQTVEELYNIVFKQE